ncbi:MAG: biotin/lipoate A/B protein ligase family protein [Thermodesulfobacteriota bacterium]
MEEWRLIIDPPCGGAENMAVDEALLRSASIDKAFSPVLRLYGWSEPTISLGYLQKAASFAGMGLPLVRRITGGRALLHEIEFTYAVIAGARSPLHSMGIAGCYAALSRAIVLTLREFGLEADFSRPMSSRAYKKSAACFASSARYEVLVGGRKIAGSAQRRVKGALLQHGSIIFGLNRALWKDIFGDDILLKTAAVLEFCSVEREAFQKVFVQKVSESLRASFTGAVLTEPELEMKKGLMEQRYLRKEWNEDAALPGAPGRDGVFMAMGGL